MVDNVCVHIYVYIHACMQIYMCVYVCLHLYVCVYIYICVYIYVCMCVYFKIKRSTRAFVFKLIIFLQHVFLTFYVVFRKYIFCIFLGFSCSSPLLLLSHQIIHDS